MKPDGKTPARKTALEQPLTLCQVLEVEFARIDLELEPDDTGGSESWETRPTAEAQAERLKTLRQAIHARPTPRSALCFSGGGIRSATFNLGVLQGLARRGWLADPKSGRSHFDFLSTVSGGGYIGSWLTAWIHREPGGLLAVARQLAQDHPEPGESPEPRPIRHLRAFSNYLSPKLGLLSPDVWTLAATIVRNLLINWFVFLPWLAVAVMTPRLCLLLFNAAADPALLERFGPMVLAASALATAVGALMSTDLLFARIDARAASAAPREDKAEKRVRRRVLREGWLLSAIGLTTTGTAVYLYWYAQLFPGEVRWWGAAQISALLLVTTTVAQAVWYGRLLFREARARKKGWLEALAAPLVEFLALMVAWVTTGALLSLASWSGLVAFGDVVLYACLGPSLLLFALFIGHTVAALLFSTWLNLSDLEWSARSSAWLLLLGLVVLLINWTAFYGPDALVRAPNALAGVGGVSGALVWAARKILASESIRGDAGGGSSRKLIVGLATTLAAPLLILLLMAGISLFLAWLIDPNNYWNPVWVARHSGWRRVLPVFGFLLGAGLLAALVTRINKFSLHSMYRDRLVRAYLGASRLPWERKDDALTGFDAADDIKLGALHPKRPLHIINGTMNVIHRSADAWQQTKSEPFTFSRLHCGSSYLQEPHAEEAEDPPRARGPRKSAKQGADRAGEALERKEIPRLQGAYRPAEQFAQGITLGTAMAISGAAASPNMGDYSASLYTFLMSLFNARLGVWLGNPLFQDRRIDKWIASIVRAPAWKRSGPAWGALHLLKETLGLLDERSKFLYISDGGHFENLGLYEMVLRRCRLVVVVDAACDPDRAYKDLGTAVRKIRVALGIPIHFERLDDLEKNGYVEARIDYPAVDGSMAKVGRLIYLRPQLVGDEPVDIRNYAKTAPAFPQQSTADQFFSEEQFESYRALGVATIERLPPGLLDNAPDTVWTSTGSTGK